MCAAVNQVAGEQLVPQGDEGLQRLVLSALLMPRALGLSPSDTTSSKNLMQSAKVSALVVLIPEGVYQKSRTVDQKPSGPALSSSLISLII